MIARLRRAGEGWVEDQAAQMGAALAYYTLFSLTPLLVLAMAVLGTVVSEAESKGHVLQFIGGINPESAEAVRVMLDSFQTAKGRVGVSAVGLASLLFGATGMFTSLRSSLWRIWRLGADGDNIVTSLLKTHLIALAMVLVSCAFLIVLLLVSAAMPLLAEGWKREIPSVPWSAPAADFVVSTWCLTLLFVFTYRFLSDGRLPYRRLWSGAFVSAVLFSAGKVAIGHYLAYVNLGSAYGAAGSLVVFLAWVYYSAQILFFGAEVIRAGLPK